jgi:hypothetical protein
MKLHQPSAPIESEPGPASLQRLALPSPLARVQPARTSLRSSLTDMPRDSVRDAPREAPPEASMDSTVIDELTKRLPTSELVKIIKGALECGKRNMPFTESDLLRTMAFGTHAPCTRATTDRGGALTPRPLPRH